MWPVVMHLTRQYVYLFVCALLQIFSLTVLAERCEVLFATQQVALKPSAVYQTRDIIDDRETRLRSISLFIDQVSGKANFETLLDFIGTNALDLFAAIDSESRTISQGQVGSLLARFFRISNRNSYQRMQEWLDVNRSRIEELLAARDESMDAYLQVYIDLVVEMGIRHGQGQIADYLVSFPEDVQSFVLRFWPRRKGMRMPENHLDYHGNEKWDKSLSGFKLESRSGLRRLVYYRSIYALFKGRFAEEGIAGALREVMWGDYELWSAIDNNVGWFYLQPFYDNTYVGTMQAKAMAFRENKDRKELNSGQYESHALLIYVLVRHRLLAGLEVPAIALKTRIKVDTTSENLLIYSIAALDAVLTELAGRPDLRTEKFYGDLVTLMRVAGEASAGVRNSKLARSIVEEILMYGDPLGIRRDINEIYDYTRFRVNGGLTDVVNAIAPHLSPFFRATTEAEFRSLFSDYVRGVAVDSLPSLFGPSSR